MGRQLTLDLPDEIYRDLVIEAERAGLPLESLIGVWLARAVQCPRPAGRLRDWAGAFASGAPDAAIRHRDHLGQALLGDARVEPDE